MLHTAYVPVQIMVLYVSQQNDECTVRERRPRGFNGYLMNRCGSDAPISCWVPDRGRRYCISDEGSKNGPTSSRSRAEQPWRCAGTWDTRLRTPMAFGAKRRTVVREAIAADAGGSSGCSARARRRLRCFLSLYLIPRHRLLSCLDSCRSTRLLLCSRATVRQRCCYKLRPEYQ